MFVEKESMATSAATPSDMDDMYNRSRRRAVRLSRQARLQMLRDMPIKRRSRWLDSDYCGCSRGCRGGRARVLDDGPVQQPDDAGSARSEREVVGHEHDRRSAVAVERLEQLENALSGRVIEIPGGFVGEEDLGRVGEGARDRDALLFSTGKLGGKVVASAREPDAVDQIGCAFHRALRSAQLERNLYVLESRERGDQLKALEDEADFFAPQSGALVLRSLSQVGVGEE